MTELTKSSLTKIYTEKLHQMQGAIDPQAIGILKRLKEGGFQAYLVGGGVRDLLVSIKPKDFDIATNALPNMVKKKVPSKGRRMAGRMGTERITIEGLRVLGVDTTNGKILVSGCVPGIKGGLLEIKTTTK